MAQNRDRRSAPALSYLFDCRVEVGTPDVTPLERSAALVGGRIRGPALDGTVLEGSAVSTAMSTEDTTLTRVDIRFTIRTEAGETVACESGGILDMPEDARERLQEGRPLPADEIYFRVTPRFWTSAPSLVWMNRIASVGIGSLRPDGAEFEVYQVL